MAGSETVPRRRSLSRSQARRIALRAQGLDTPRPTGPVDRGHVRRVLEHLGLVQLDSVNVLARTQYVTLFSRLGPYDPDLLDRVAYRDRVAFEYWGHVASLVHVRHHPDLRWRMADAHAWGGPERVAAERPGLVAELEREVVVNGPLTAGDLEEPGRRKGPWWDWGEVKQVLEYLFWAGRIGAQRRGNFERVYCAPEQAVPPELLSAPTPPDDEAHRNLLRHAARLHGVGTARDLADVWRHRVPEARPVLHELAAAGELEVVDVEGWGEPAYLHPDATLPRRVDACALVSPFDSAMWERDRIERLFGFEYRIEIYVPRAKRRWGYYVLPFLLGDTYVARVDLKADRAGSALLVQSAWREPDLGARDTDELEVAERLSAELRLLADWLGLDDVVVVGPGDLAPALAAVSPARG